jgi:hypothetical protein
MESGRSGLCSITYPGGAAYIVGSCHVEAGFKTFNLRIAYVCSVEMAGYGQLSVWRDIVFAYEIRYSAAVDLLD